MRAFLATLSFSAFLPLALATCTGQGSQQAGAAPDTGAAVSPASSAPASTAAIDSLRTAYAAAVNAHDSNAVLGLYADNAVVIAPDGTTYNGRDAIRGWLADTTMVPSDVRIQNAQGPFMAGDMAWETGTYSQTLTPKAGAPQQMRGSYLVVAQRQPAGAWKIVGLANVPEAGPGMRPDTARP